MIIDVDFLAESVRAVGVESEERMLGLLEAYAEFLIDYNEKVNLTAITAPEEIAVKHFADSLSLLPAIAPEQGARIADVGAGAGFPSVPLLTARPDLKITMIDSSNKRVTFLRLLMERLGLAEKGSEAVHMRAEEAGTAPEHREKYDFAVARAVANLRELSEYCLPLVKLGGTFAAMKGADVDEELSGAEKAIALMGGSVEQVKRFILPNGDGRSIILIKKISQTPAKYPRPSAKIAKKPLV